MAAAAAEAPWDLGSSGRWSVNAHRDAKMATAAKVATAAKMATAAKIATAAAEMACDIATSVLDPAETRGPASAAAWARYPARAVILGQPSPG